MPVAGLDETGATLLDFTTVDMVVGLATEVAALVEVIGALAGTLEVVAFWEEAAVEEAALELTGAAPEPDPLTVKSMQDS